jgi:hypothetical protein
VTSGQTPVLDPSEARALLDSIDTSTVVGLRDRALIGLALGAASSRVSASIHVATCTGCTAAIDGTPTVAHQARILPPRGHRLAVCAGCESAP